MKKKFQKRIKISFMLTFLLIPCSCSYVEEHVHSFTENVNEKYLCSSADCENPATYFLSCKCGEIDSHTFTYGEALGHDFTNRVESDEYLNVAADCENPTTYYYSCRRCGEKGRYTYKEGEAKGHSYTKKIVSDEYLCTPSDCEHPATYFYSCECGAKGNETFELGTAKGHIYTKQVTTNRYLCSEADCTHAAKYYYSCECGEKGTETFEYGSPLGHKFDKNDLSEEFLCSEATYEHPSIYYYSCSICGEKSDLTFEHGVAKEHKFVNKVIEKKYQCTEADCKNAATYYYSCACGEKGTETFSYGDPIPHSFELPIDSSDYSADIIDYVKLPTNEEDGICTIKCSGCGEIFERKVNKINIEDYLVIPYIASSGNESIDTMISPSKSLTTKIELSLDENYISDKEYSIFGAEWSTNGYMLSVGSSGITFKSSGVSSITHSVPKGTFSIETKPTDNKTLDSTNSITLFDVGKKINRGRFKLYSFKLFDNGNAIRAFIPVIDSKSGESGLLDLIENKFYGDENHGGFVLPEGYSSIITKAPTNNETGIRTIKTPDYQEGFEVTIPTINEEQYKIVNCIQSSGNEKIDTHILVDYYDSAISNVDIQIISGRPSDWAGCNYLLEFDHSYIGHNNRSVIRDEYNLNNNHTTNIYDNNNFLLEDTWKPATSLRHCRFGLLGLGNINNTWHSSENYQIARLFGGDISVNGKQCGLFLPAYDVLNDEYGMYNCVTNEFLGNDSGKGKLINPAIKEEKENSFEELYKKLDYIETTGDQYIDTNFIPDSDTSVEAGFYADSIDGHTHFYGSGVSFSSRNVELYGTNESTLEVHYSGYHQMETNMEGVWFDFRQTKNSNYVFVNNSIIESYKFCRKYFSSPYTLCIFADNRGEIETSSQNIKCSYFKLFDNGVLIRDYVPCSRKSDGEIGLYDLVNNEFYTNKGTGEFITGQIEKEEIPSEYKQVEYIETNGTQKINTGIYGQAKWIYDIQFTNNYELQVMGHYGKDFAYWEVKFGLYALTDEVYSYNYAGNRDIWQINNFEGETPAGIGGEVYINGDFGYENPYSEISEQYEAKLFGLGSEAMCSCKLYSCQVYDTNNNLLRDFVPSVRLSDGEAGLYDKVTGTFYTNDGSGDFILPVTEKLPEESYTFIDHLDINEENYLILDEDYNDYFEVNATSNDHKEVYPLYDGGYRLGIGTYGNYSVSYTLYGLSSYFDEEKVHDYVPACRNKDHVVGLYDLVSGDFYVLQYLTNNSPTKYFFMDNDKFNVDFGMLSLELASYKYYPQAYFAANGYDLISSFYSLDYLDLPYDAKVSSYSFYTKDYCYNGNTYHLYFLHVLGTSGETEWFSNATVGNSENGFHEGFEDGADFILDRIVPLISEDTEHSKFIIDGYSRGSSVGSIIAAKMMEQGIVKEENLTGYFFACPNYSSRDVRYNNLFQVSSPMDLISYVPTNEWGFYKEGNVITFPMDEVTMENLRNTVGEYQIYNDEHFDWHETYGYDGFDYNLMFTMRRLSSILSEEAVRNVANVDSIIEIYRYIIGERTDIPIEALNVLVSELNFDVVIKDSLFLAQFLAEAKNHVAGSHEQATYLAYLHAIIDEGIILRSTHN